MIDRKARDDYAQLLRHFAAGRVLNWDYEDIADPLVDSDDPALFPVFWAVWPTYCDIRKHTLTGADRLDRDARRVVARCILFLYSNREYEWPTTSRWRVLLNVLTFGVWGAINPMPPSGGDDEVWPFFRRSDLSEEALRPRLLAGVR